MKEYRLYQDGENYIMEEYIDNEMTFATMGNSEFDCIKQMFKIPDSTEKTFILHWNDNKTEEIKGNSISNAMMKAGIGGGALIALDYWEEKK